MRKKLFKNKLLWIRIAICIIILIALVGNFAVLFCLSGNEQSQSAWLTLYGGWLGFLATLIIGIIAYQQSNKFTFESKKQNLISIITNYMRDIQEGFVNHVKVENLIDLHNMRFDIGYMKIRNEKENEILKCELKYNDLAIELLNHSLFFEVILAKGFYFSDDIIDFHKKLIELEDIIQKLNYCDGKNNYNEQFYINKRQEFQRCINKWTGDVFILANKIQIDFQTLRSKVLTMTNLSDLHKLEKNLTEEEYKISSYFQDNLKIRVQELQERGVSNAE